MKIAVTSQNRSSVTDHAGKCRNFWIYETEYADVVDKRLLELNAESCFHDAFPAQLAGINVLISAGMAETLRFYLQRHGVEAVTTRESDPDRAVAAWLNGSLRELPPLACGGSDCHSQH